MISKEHLYHCTKKIKVEYAHQLYSSYTELCHETIHGHSGVIEIEFSSMALNKDNMVIDFGEISNTIKAKIMEKYDHALFMPKMFDAEYLDMLKKYNKRITITPENPTAEYFAFDIFRMADSVIQDKFPDRSVVVKKVNFHETETGCATYGMY